MSAQNVYTYLHTHICTQVRAWLRQGGQDNQDTTTAAGILMSVHMSAHMSIHMCVFIHACAHVHALVCLYMAMYMCVDMWIYMTIRCAVVERAWGYSPWGMLRDDISASPMACPSCRYGRAGTQNDRLSLPVLKMTASPRRSF